CTRRGYDVYYDWYFDVW
nr:immunoglobulin heavy chain junction region [Mus musculus]NSM09120.1 immunoglobulin heavy chain junction region [Mus musculus]